jgi:uncharacterized membrane protein required for colicin V production
MAERFGIDTVDAILLAFLALFLVEGLRRGLLREVLDLLGVGLAGALALRGYERAGGWVAERLSLSPALGHIAAFFGVFVAGLLAFAIASAFVERVLGIVVYHSPLSVANALGGASLGLAKGLVFAALLLRATTLLPLGAAVTDSIGQSRVGARIAGAFADVLPYLEDAFNQIGKDALLIVPPAPGGERTDLNLPRGITVWPDPDSEEVMLRLVNRERALAGLPALAPDERLRAVARGHSEEMFRLDYFSHDSPLSGTPFDRLRQSGIRFGAAGENLAYAPTVEVAHRGLMNSPEHRRNILAPEFRRVGIGIVQSGLWGRMFSQEFTD